MIDPGPPLSLEGEGDRGVLPVLNPVSNPDSQKLSKPPQKSFFVRFVMFLYVSRIIELCRFP